MVVAHGADISLGPGTLSCAVWDFAAAVASGDAAAAVESYAGPFLDGWFVPEAGEFERWAEGQRTDFAQRFA